MLKAKYPRDTFLFGFLVIKFCLFVSRIHGDETQIIDKSSFDAKLEGDVIKLKDQCIDAAAADPLIRSVGRKTPMRVLYHFERLRTRATEYAEQTIDDGKKMNFKKLAGGKEDIGAMEHALEQAIKALTANLKNVSEDFTSALKRILNDVDVAPDNPCIDFEPHMRSSSSNDSSTALKTLKAVLSRHFSAFASRFEYLKEHKATWAGGLSEHAAMTLSATGFKVNQLIDEENKKREGIYNGTSEKTNLWRLKKALSSLDKNKSKESTFEACTASWTNNNSTIERLVLNKQKELRQMIEARPAYAIITVPDRVDVRLFGFFAIVDEIAVDFLGQFERYAHASHEATLNRAFDQAMATGIEKNDIDVLTKFVDTLNAYGSKAFEVIRKVYRFDMSSVKEAHDRQIVAVMKSKGIPDVHDSTVRTILAWRQTVSRSAYQAPELFREATALV